MPQTITLSLDIEITREAFKEWARDRKKNISKLIGALDPELQAFDRYLEANKMDPMSNIERQMIREYVGWKLVSDG